MTRDAGFRSIATIGLIGLSIALASCRRDESETEEPPAAAEDAPVALRIARGQDFAPYHFESDGRLQGFEIEIIREVARTTGREARFEQYPWSRCLAMVESGQVDAMMNIFQTEDRERFLYFRAENILHHEENTLWIRRDREDIVYRGQPAELGGHRLGAIQDYSYGSEFDRVAGGLDIEFSVDERALLRKLVHRRVDVIVGNTLVLEWLARTDGVRDQVVQLEPGLSEDPLYLAFSRARPGNEEVASRFGDALRRFKGTAEYLEVLERYGVAPDPTDRR